MAEPFKNELGVSRICIIAEHLSRHDSNFNKKQFIKLACNNLDALSLMERNRQIVETMYCCLPDEFVHAKRIICHALAPENEQTDEKGLHSWLTVPLAEYLGRYGKDNLKEAFDGLAQVTPLFSSEWGIRHLLDHHQDAGLQQLRVWCEHENEHVRRLVSEGSRPRLPWGFQLRSFIQSPDLTFPLLEKLKDDKSDYVRLSVSNHLNDISKDHPEYLQSKLENWIDQDNPKRMKLIRHACRTLIKKGHQGTLNMLGYRTFPIKQVHIHIIKNPVEYGAHLEFQFSFSGEKYQDVIIDYAIHFKKSNGDNTPKVFKWKVGNLGKSGEFKASKKHAIKPITTRKYYNGDHELEVLVNGMSVIKVPFELFGVG